MHPTTATRCLLRRPAGPERGGDPPVLTELGTVAADCLARAVARGVYEATALPFPGAVPDWKTKFGGGAMMSYLVVFVGAGIGGAARHGMNIWVARLLGSHFPWHTLVINILGSIVMGLITGWFAERIGAAGASTGCSSPPASWAASRPSPPSRSTPCCCGSGMSI